MDPRGSGLRGNWARRSRFVGSRLEGCQAIKKRAWRVEIRVNVSVKPHLYDIHFGVGTSKFWQAGRKSRARPASFTRQK